MRDAAFWRGEIDRGRRLDESRFPQWQENLNYYTGTPLASEPSTDYVNVNVDFYQVEQKGAVLFFDTPALQLSPGKGFQQLGPGVLAHRALLDVLLGPDHMNILPTILASVKDCTCTAGRGAVVVGYQPTIQPVSQTPQPGAILGLSQSVPVPIHEDWFCERIPSKKFHAPADFTSCDFEKAPWLAMDFRIPLAAAQRMFTLPPDFTGTTTSDDKVLESGPQPKEAPAGLAYVDGVLVWYKAALFDDDVIHPELYRRHVLIQGIDDYADNPDPVWASPYQTLDPTGRLTADSLIGNPIDVLTLRDVPDSQYVPSDSQMTRPLVKELCLFRTQMVRERDVNTTKFGYNTDVITQTDVEKITQAMTGSLIGLPPQAFAGGGLEQNFKELAKGTAVRQTYLANDYITKDIQKTLALDEAGIGVQDEANETATKTAEVAKSRNIRIDAERKRVLRWYLRLVDKVSALALRFCTDPRRVAELIGPEAAQDWLQWRQQLLTMGDPRPKFDAKPNSQLHLDAAQELMRWIKAYEFLRKDPLVNGAGLARKIFELLGEDPATFVTDQPPQQKPDASMGFSFKGDDVNPLNPQYAIVLELLAQLGYQVSPTAVQEAQQGAANQVLAQMQSPTPAGPKAPMPHPMVHGGLADKVPPMSKHTADQSGERSGPKVGVQ